MSNDPWDEFPDSGFLRDSSGELMGRLERRSDGSEWITDYSDNQLAGRYDPSSTPTWDAGGQLVGFGNLLASLLRRR